MARILVIGGYGVFGTRAAERLAGRPGIELIVAGRDGARAASLAQALAAGAEGRVEPLALDAAQLTPDQLVRARVDIVVHTAGPFQAQDYRVAEAAIAAGAHYIDLADARRFVTGIGVLDAQAKARGVLAVSGASSVPAVAAAVLDAMRRRLATIETLRYGIVPGNSFDPGPATVASILSGAGRPFQARREGRWTTVRGWLPLERERIEGMGVRWLGHCDVPDLDLFPERYPGLRTQDFYGGLEVKAFHAGVVLLALLVRLGLLGDAGRLARPLLWVKRRLAFLGSDRGIMFIEAWGRDHAGQQQKLRWELLAREGHGPYVPSLPAVVIAAKLASGTLAARGAMPCVGLVSLEDLAAETAGLAIMQGFR